MEAVLAVGEGVQQDAGQGQEQGEVGGYGESHAPPESSGFPGSPVPRVPGFPGFASFSGPR
jgi:hypothetical protein